MGRTDVDRTLSKLVPELRERIESLMTQMDQLGCPIVVVEGFRTYERQSWLYGQGRTRPGAIVTGAREGQSWHNFGRAVDLAFKGADGKVTWSGPWDILGEEGERLGLFWGVVSRKTGRRYDLGHFEYRGGLTLSQARREWEARKAKG